MVTVTRKIWNCDTPITRIGYSTCREGGFKFSKRATHDNDILRLSNFQKNVAFEHCIKYHKVKMICETTDIIKVCCLIHKHISTKLKHSLFSETSF